MVGAISVSEVLLRLGEVFYTIVLPILLLAGVGWLIQRRMGLEMQTLRRLNFYFIMPALIYFSLLTSSLTAGAVGTVVAFALACLALQAGLTWGVARLRGVPADVRRAMMMTTMFHNSGNYGLPLQELAFAPVGLGAVATSYQAFVMLTQNFTNFTLGILVVSGGKAGRTWRQNLLHIAKFPPLYAIAAALATMGVRQALGARAPGVAEALTPLWAVVAWVRGAFVPIALLTLGAQLALVRRGGQDYPIRWSVMLRLLAGPGIAMGVIHAMGLQGLLAQVLLISSATPTAVNVMLLCLEFDNHPDYAARAVFYSTLLSPITVTAVICLAQGGGLPGFG